MSTSPKAQAYDGRVFLDRSQRYVTTRRVVTGQTANRVWLYTVDVVRDVESEEIFLRLVRWRARRGNDEHPADYWQFFRAYNLRSMSQWNGMSRVVDWLLHEEVTLSGTELIHPEEFDVGILHAKERRIADLEVKYEKERSTRISHKAQLRRARQREREMKSHISEYRRTLNEFKGLVGKADTVERDVHRFIEENESVWLFGLEYLDIESRVPFPPRPQRKKYEFDLMLRRHDDFIDLVELKGPNDSPFDRRTKHRTKLNKPLSEALGQVLAYLSECDKMAKKRFIRPKAIIVIGNENTDDPVQRRLLVGQMTRLELHTYTDLVRHGEQLLKHIEGKKS